MIHLVALEEKNKLHIVFICSISITKCFIINDIPLYNKDYMNKIIFMILKEFVGTSYTMTYTGV